MSDELVQELRELKEAIKEDVKSDLGKGYYKMRQSSIITLIGCTITACLSIFGGVLYIDRHLNSNSEAVVRCQIDITDIKSKQGSLWNKCGDLEREDNNLQQQINNLYQDKIIK